MKPQPPDDLWEKMDKLHEALDIPTSAENFDDGFTVEDYAHQYKTTQQNARCRLKQMVEQGKLLSSWKNREGHRIRVYRFT